MKKLVLFALVISAVILACGNSSGNVVQPKDNQPPEDKPTDTKVPVATNTPKPTNTPRPTATPEPTIAPVLIQGSGDDIVNVPDSYLDGGIMMVNNSGNRNFIIWGYDNAGNQVDLFVNTIGKYNGKRLFNQFVDETITRFSVESDGSWTIEFAPISPENFASITVPGEVDGTGDDLLLVLGEPDTIEANAKGSSNFIVWVYSDEGYDLVFNEIAPYNGTKILPRGVYIIEVIAEGEWTINIK